ncbi:MAG: hypothetical protein P8P74_17205 [Crocinitomicaceae bacterium]|nr:hypothetical protein [Crocinitomicaceae bacterium]
MSTKHCIENIPSLKNIKGVSYSPAPSDDKPAPPSKYFDTDFANSCFPKIWDDANGGRGDIKNLAGLGVNFIHLYNWSVPPAPGNTPGSHERSHTTFLNKCGNENVNVFVPISNYFLGEIANGNGATAKTQIAAMVKEVYNGGTKRYGGAAMWGVANEYDLQNAFSAANIATAMEYILEAESSQGIPASELMPITSPVSFGTFGEPLKPGIVKVKELQTAIEANSSLGTTFWNSRFVASVNPFNDGTFIANYIATTFPTAFPDTYFFFSEMGSAIQAGTPSSDEAQQAAYVLDQLNNSNPSGYFLGRCVFQFLDQTAMKTGTEATFGMNKFSGTSTTSPIQPSTYDPGGGDNYTVDVLTKKPLHASVKTVYSK